MDVVLYDVQKASQMSTQKPKGVSRRRAPAHRASGVASVADDTAETTQL